MVNTVRMIEDASLVIGIEDRTAFVAVSRNARNRLCFCPVTLVTAFVIIDSDVVS
jgi:hypothetical protein